LIPSLDDDVFIQIFKQDDDEIENQIDEKMIEENDDHVEKQIEELEDLVDLVDEKEENIEFNWLYNDDHSENSSTTNDDLFGVSLANAHEDLYSGTESKQILWPSETFKEFMIAVIQHRISDAAADSMLRIIKKHCNESLPSSTQKGRILMNQMDIKNLNFETRDLVEFEGKTYKFQYLPIFNAIKNLISNPDLTKDFLLDYQEQWELDNVSFVKTFC